MTFRKCSAMFREEVASCSILTLVSLAMIPFIGLGIPLLFMLLSAFLGSMIPKSYEEWITIDENGIACQKLGKQIWMYKWNEIVMLKKGTRFRWPSVEIITYDKYGNPELYGLPDRYFLLGKKAKTAINTYCPAELNKLKKK